MPKDILDTDDATLRNEYIDREDLENPGYVE